MPRHRAPDGVDVYHQVLPADFAARLAGLYTEATRRPDTELSGGMRAWLNDMYQRARKVRGGTPLDHPDRIISETLSAVLADLKYRCRVPASRLADAMGCEEGTVWMRLSRHGYRTLAPSQQPYRRMVARRLARPDPSPGERYEAWVRDQETRQVLGQ
jgi:hypothetical protein